MMIVSAVSAQAYTAEVQPFVICSSEIRSNEFLAEHMPLVPASGATLQAGATVVFTGESGHALTFSLASSPALLSSSDIDSGMGEQSGASYRFISAKAAVPRTVYWTASFTLTPRDCESPSTFTTPTRTLTILPSLAEQEAAAKDNHEPEAAIPGGVSLEGSTFEVQRAGKAAIIKLTCTGADMCAGRLTCMAKTRAKGKSKAEAIGGATFSIPPGKATTIKLTLNALGKTLLSAGHGHLGATLRILMSSPAPAKTRTTDVHLVIQHKAHAKPK
jgi:hypothetical protein